MKCGGMIIVLRIMGDEPLLSVQHGSETGIFRELNNGEILEWIATSDRKAKR